MFRIWEKANEGKAIGKKEFEMCSAFTRFNLHLENKDRGAAYKFTNKDYASKLPRWLPEGSEDCNIFEELPDGWNQEAPPIDDPHMEPTGYVMEIFGDTPGIKGQVATTVAISQRMKEMCEKFRDIRSKVFEEVDPNDAFFINFKGEPLGPMLNQSGTLLHHFSHITGVWKATVTTARRTATSILQSDPILKNQEHRVQHHSDSVALNIYDRGGPNLKLQVINFTGKREGTVHSETKLTEEVKNIRDTRATKDRELAIASAKEIQLNDAMRKKASKLTKTCRALPEHRSFFQTVFKSPEAV